MGAAGTTVTGSGSSATGHRRRGTTGTTGSAGTREPAGAAGAAALPAPAVATSVSPTPTARRALAHRRPVPSCCAPSATTASTTARRARRPRPLSVPRRAPPPAVLRTPSARRCPAGTAFRFTSTTAAGRRRCRSTDAATTLALATPTAPTVRGVSAPSGTRAPAFTALAGPTSTAPRDRAAAASWLSWGDLLPARSSLLPLLDRSLRQQRRSPRPRARIRSGLRPQDRWPGHHVPGRPPAAALIRDWWRLTRFALRPC